MNKTAERSHWHILGPGAIGTLFAHRLDAAGSAVTLLHHSENRGQVPHTLQSGSGEQQRELELRHAGAAGPITHLLVTTKAPRIREAIESISLAVTADAVILLMVNGMGHREYMIDALPGRSIFVGTTSEGAYRESRTLTVHAGVGTTRIGYPDRAIATPAWFSDSFGLLERCHWDNSINLALWRKLAVNCAINGLTAVHHCRNGALLENTSARRELDALCHEIVAALRALGYPQIAAQLISDVYDVLRATSANRSSMLTDIMAGRETEIDAINGYLLRKAAAMGLYLRRNAALVAAVQALGPALD